MSGGTNEVLTDFANILEIAMGDIVKHLISATLDEKLEASRLKAVPYLGALVEAGKEAASSRAGGGLSAVPNEMDDLALDVPHAVSTR